MIEPATPPPTVLTAQRSVWTRGFGMEQGAIESSSAPFQPRASMPSSDLDIEIDWPSPWRKAVGNFMESKSFELPMAMLIVANCVLVVMDTNLRADVGESPVWMQGCMVAVLLIYIIDITIRLWVWRWSFFKKSMNVFDITIVGIDCITEVLSFADVEYLSFVSALRILRLGRLLRFIRLIAFFQELVVMCHLMFAALRTILWASLLMSVMLILCGIMAVEFLHPLNKEIAKISDVYEGCERCPRAYATVEQSCLTFFQQIIAGDGWGQTSVALIEYYPFTALFLAAVLFTINLGLMNLVVTVIVDKAQEARESNVTTFVQQKEQEWRVLKDVLYKHCEMLDTDRSGELSLEELLNGYDNCEDFGNTLKLMTIDRNDMSLLFGVLDNDHSGSVSYGEFVDQLHKMKTQSTHSVCIMIKAYVRLIKKNLSEEIDRVHVGLKEEIQDLADSLRRAGTMKMTSVFLGEADETEGSVHAPSMPWTSSQGAKEPDPEHAEIFFRLQGQLERQIELVARSSEVLASLAQSTQLVASLPATGRSDACPEISTTWMAPPLNCGMRQPCSDRQQEVGAGRDDMLADGDALHALRARPPLGDSAQLFRNLGRSASHPGESEAPLPLPTSMRGGATSAVGRTSRDGPGMQLATSPPPIRNPPDAGAPRS